MRASADLSWPVLVLLAAAAVAWPAFTRHRTETRTARAESSPDDRVDRIARAIAVAEGYYAGGDYDGRSLPFRLNNPGSLKKPALHAASLPTWQDTGLIEFPTSDMGWEALRYQVRLMLSGASRVYDPTDSLLLVAGKYADGDLNWGLNVAAGLGVSPCATLADLRVDEAGESADAGLLRGKRSQP